MYTVESETSTAQTESPKRTRFSRHWVSAVLLAGLLVVVGLATAWNLEGWPGRVDDDEGTYVAQAWAIVYEHTLTHYSYWYDHPPGGWIQIAAFAWVTDGFNRVTDAVFVGRQFMVCVTLVSCVLVYLLCRRLGLRQATSAVAVLLFGLSPIAQYYHRLVSLDNIETMWVLAALVAATSPRRGWGPALRTGVCTAIAIMSKETALILLPVIVWVLLQRDDAGADTAAVAATVAADPDSAADPAAAPGDGAGTTAPTPGG
jgi:4-amino-4-deoxy-L-arabinose transferase-like glycosyltransferase